jgi:hypothetical protein
MNKTIFPIQPMQKDEGYPRFIENRIVTYLLEKGPFDLNHLAVLDFSNEEREQFAQLIGYSLGGFGELSYVSDETYGAAEKMSKGKSEEQARIEHLETLVESLREDFKSPICELYGLNPDDLERYC